MHHGLQVLSVFNVELGHVLLELSLFIINLVLQLNNFLSKSQLRSNGAMEGDAQANGKLQIIKAEIGGVKPFINEVLQYFHIKERQIIEDFRLLLALNQLLKSIITALIVC